ncbi:hypothetical protein IV102_14685 [bacterium]|nr:hypothetical protein [bacterium]
MNRKNAPGVFRDNESKHDISVAGAGQSLNLQNESPWPQHPDSTLPPFKQFHHQGDAGVDLSCMAKARRQLTAHGYPDAGAVVVTDEDGRRSLLEHFWRGNYNQPMLDFFDSQL